jgi:hypothetical protein
MPRLGLLCGLLLTALLLPTSSWAATDDFSIQLRHAGGRLLPGGTVQVQVQILWDGRPELHVPSAPKLQLPAGATQTLGRTGSDFDGNSTRWWSNVRVNLPDSPAPWTVGPAEVLVRSDAGVETLRSQPATLGRRSALSALIGQGLGSTVVVLFLVTWVGFRLRGLQAEELAEKPDYRDVLMNLDAAKSSSGDQAWELLIKARLALGAQSIDNADLPSLEDLQERLERSRFGGESISDLECRELGQILNKLLET